MKETQSHYRTLTLVSVLHAFTHLYQIALMPLYLPIQKSFGLESVGSATFLVDAESNLGTALGGMGDMPGMELTTPPKPLDAPATDHAAHRPTPRP